MNFDENKAKELINKYSLSKKNLYIWRKNNHIPDIYDYKDTSVYKNMIERHIPLLRSHTYTLLNTRKIKQTILNDVSGLGRNKLNRVMLDQGSLSYEEYLSLIDVIFDIKVQTEQAIDALRNKMKEPLHNYFSQEIINVMAVFQNNNEVYMKVNQSKKNHGRTFPFEYADLIEGYLHVFLLELKFLLVYLHYQAEFSV
jgi:hypothetical protein